MRVPFLLDYAVNIRLLVTLPLLIFAQISWLTGETSLAVRHFVNSGLVTDDMLPSYEAVIRRTVTFGDSRVVRVMVPSILAFSSTAAYYFQMARYSRPGPRRWQGSLAQSGNASHSAAGFYNLIVAYRFTGWYGSGGCG